MQRKKHSSPKQVAQFEVSFMSLAQTALDKLLQDRKLFEVQSRFPDYYLWFSVVEWTFTWSAENIATFKKMPRLFH